MKKSKVQIMFITMILLMMFVNNQEWMSYYSKQTVNTFVLAVSLAYCGRRFSSWMMIQLNKNRNS